MKQQQLEHRHAAVETSPAASWETLASRVLMGERLTVGQAMAILEAEEDEVLPLLYAAYRIRKHYFGKLVKLNMTLMSHLSSMMMSLYAIDDRLTPFYNCN
ncbi:hypothetical protein [Paenibacillus sp. SYP-B4298]|uniref:hypothetical protein n=1 Tax=Paenibacillus sp. SYP-B4298 TaxID=2996034 RepID=UPI0022DD8986|nr:hypothetical protein [Paenibacillus sp. SYP-B4298]